MLWEDNYLAHYGIVKQRWGIRRFQNKDGSLTEEGRKRYRDFSRAEDKVRKRRSNHYSAFKREPFSIAKVMERGGISEGKAHECCDYADKLFKKAQKIEPMITRDVVSAVEDSGCMMYGLENRIKQPTSIAAKIGQDAKEKEISISDAAKGIKDIIRYTSIADDDRFTKSYQSIRFSLSDFGYSEVSCKNYFELYREGKSRHKAVQCVYADSDGNRFELQFHTPASQAAKELKIPIFEARRKSGLSEERQNELEQQMTELAEKVKNPNGVFTIKSH